MFKNIFVIIVVFIVVLAFVVLYLNQTSTKFHKDTITDPEIGIRYVAIGDSYTIGLGIEEKDRWPNILTNHLKEMKIDIHLVANLAVSGYTVRNVIELELKEVENIRPDFVTVLIGANDNFGQKDVENYRQELQELLDKLQQIVENPNNIVLITLPDYTKSPALRLYQKEEILKLIRQYNNVIKDEGKRRGMVVADIFPISQTMTNASDYISDGLHPSAQGYIKWESIIFPIVFNLFKPNSIIKF